jgi:predicted protein tyrosine phosphatase
MAVHEIEGRIVYVLSRKMSENFCWHKPWIGISISSGSSSDKGFPDLKEENRVGLLQLDFPDWEFVRPSMSLMRQDQLGAEGEKLKESKIEAFNKEQAEQILDFMDDKWDQADALMVHCMAGMSRSPAIAAAIKEIKDKESKEFFESGEYMPNQLVFNQIIDVAKERGLT